MLFTVHLLNRKCRNTDILNVNKSGCFFHNSYVDYNYKCLFYPIDYIYLTCMHFSSKSNSLIYMLVVIP